MQKITPFLWYDKEARQAAEFYVSIFGEDSKITSEMTMPDTPSGTVEVLTVSLRGMEMTLMSAGPFAKFNESISFVINCKDQAEVDYFWEKLSAIPESEQCGWLKDKFGVSWQVTPEDYQKYVNGPDPKKRAAAAQAMMTMKKLDLAALKKAYEEG